MKNFKLFAFVAAFSTLAIASETPEVTTELVTTEVVTTIEEVVAPVTTEVATTIEEVVAPVTTEVATTIEEVVAPVAAEVATTIEEVVAPVAAEVVVAPVTTAPVAQSTFDSVKSSVVNGFNLAITKTKSAANTTASYAKVPFVKANELCNTLNGKMFTVAAEDNSYSAMLKNNATQITAGTLVTAAVVYGAYTYFNKPVVKSAKN